MIGKGLQCCIHYLGADLITLRANAGADSGDNIGRARVICVNQRLDCAAGFFVVDRKEVAIQVDPGPGSDVLLRRLAAMNLTRDSGSYLTAEPIL